MRNIISWFGYSLYKLSTHGDLLSVIGDKSVGLSDNCFFLNPIGLSALETTKTHLTIYMKMEIWWIQLNIAENRYITTLL